MTRLERVLRRRPRSPRPPVHRPRSLPGFALLALAAIFAGSAAAQQTQWTRPEKAGDPLVWGRRDGIVFGLQSEGGIRGPRGLIRIGVFKPGDPKPQLLNFIAVEPVIAGQANASTAWPSANSR